MTAEEAQWNCSEEGIEAVPLPPGLALDEKVH